MNTCAEAIEATVAAASISGGMLSSRRRVYKMRHPWVSQHPWVAVTPLGNKRFSTWREAYDYARMQVYIWNDASSWEKHIFDLQ